MTAEIQTNLQRVLQIGSQSIRRCFKEEKRKSAKGERERRVF
jgi:hypothetical protein